MYNDGQQYLHNKIVKHGVLSKEKLSSLQFLDRELQSVFVNYNLSKDFIREINTYFNYCKQVLITNTSYVTDINSYDHILLEKNKHVIISNEIFLIKEKLEEKLKRRSKIIGKVYNYQTNKLEYELEDGMFIEINPDNSLTSPIIELDKSIFPDCWLYVSGDIASLRNNRINDILD